MGGEQRTPRLAEVAQRETPSWRGRRHEHEGLLSPPKRASFDNALPVDTRANTRPWHWKHGILAARLFLPGMEVKIVEARSWIRVLVE